jgi:hypothetical protein
MRETISEANQTAEALARLSIGATAANITSDSLERTIGTLERAKRASLSLMDVETLRSRQAQDNMRGEAAAQELLGVSRSRSAAQAQRDFEAALATAGRTGQLTSRETGRFAGSTDEARLERVRAAQIEEQALFRTTFDIETRGMERVAAAQRASADQMIADLKRIQIEEEKATKQRAAFSQQMAPSSSLAERNAINKFTFDAETAGWARVAAAQTAATNTMIGNLKRFQAEEAKADAERFRFAQQIAPQMAVRYSTDVSGNLRAINVAAVGASQGLGSTASAMSGVEGNSARLSKELGHGVAMFDELASRRFSQMMSTIGAALRDAGFQTGVLIAGMVGLSAVMAFEGLNHLMNRFGELALKQRTAAGAAGMSIDQYSRLASLFALVAGDAARLDQVFGMLAEHAEEAKADPFSKTASAFASLKISMADLDAGMQNPASLLEVLRQRWQAMGESMQRTEVFRVLLGRGFEALVPYLNLTSSELTKLNNTVNQTGAFLDQKMTAQLVTAGEKSHEFSLAVQGLEQRIAILVSGSGISDWVIKEFESLSHATDGWNAFFESIKLDKLAALGGLLKSLAGVVGPPSWLLNPLGNAPPPVFKIGEIQEARRAAPFGQRGAADRHDSEEFERYDLTADKRRLDRQVKLIHDETAIRDADFAKQIAEAGHNRDLANQIAQQRAQFNIEQAQREAEARKPFVERAERFNQPPEVIDVLKNDTEGRVRAITGLTEAERAAQASRDQQYQTFRQQKLDEIALIKNQQEELRSTDAPLGQQEAFAREAATKIAAIWAELRDKSTSIFRQGVEEFERLEKDRVNAATASQREIRELRAKEFSASMELQTSTERLGQLQIRATHAQLAAQVSSHQISKAQAAALEERFTETVFAQEEARTQAMLQNSDLTATQKQKLYEHLAELYAKDAEVQTQAQAKITADIEAENEKRKKAFTQLFDGIGSSLESSLSGLLTGQTTFAKAIQNVKNSIISGIVSTVSSVASEAAGKSLGPSLGLTAEQSKGGLGSVLGTALFKSLGLEKDVPQDAMKGVAEKWQKAVDAQGKATDLQAKAAQDLSKAAEALLNAAGGRGTGGGRSVAGGTASDESDYGAAGEYGGVGSDPRNKAGVVRAAAEKYGIDPDIGLRVARSEGLATFKGDNGTSFGAMQLHVGGGVGDRFRKETGLDPSDPKNEDATIDYAMKVAAKEGWGQWHGAALAGIKNWQGIGTGAGRDVPNGSVVDPPAWRATAADNPPEFTAAFGDSIAVGFKKVAGIGGNPVGGRNPAEVLASLNDTDLSKLEGKNVFLSSGASNINANRPDTTFAQQNAEMEQVKAQIARLQSEGAGVTLSGVGGGVANADQVNARLKQIAEDTGAGFTGQIAGTIGRVHPKEYNSLLEQASRVGNVGPTSRPHDVGATGEYGVGQGANQLKSSVDKLDSTTKFQTTTLTQANDNTQQLAGRITGTTQSDDQLKSATTDDKTATTSNTSAVQALTAKIGTTATGGVGASGNTYASPPVGLGGTTASQSNYDPFLGMNVTPGQNLGASSLNGGDGIAASMSGLSGGFSSLTGVLGVASSAASLFGGAAGKAASSILGTVTSIVGLVSKIGGMFGGGGGGGALGGIGSIFSGITGLFSLFALEQGGVIPSAAGGLSVNDGKGGTLAIVHPRETVLPAHLSTGIQNMISRGGGNDNGSSSSGDTHHYNINVNSIDSRSGAQFLMAHSDSIARSLNRARRNFNPAA